MIVKVNKTNLSDYIDSEIEKQGLKKRWVAEKVNINYKTFMDKLNRNSFTAEEFLKLISVMDLNLNDVKKKCLLTEGQHMYTIKLNNFTIKNDKYLGDLDFSTLNKLYTNSVLMMNLPKIRKKSDRIAIPDINIDKVKEISEMIRENKYSGNLKFTIDKENSFIKYENGELVIDCGNMSVIDNKEDLFAICQTFCSDGRNDVIGVEIIAV